MQLEKVLSYTEVQYREVLCRDKKKNGWMDKATELASEWCSHEAMMITSQTNEKNVSFGKGTCCFWL